MAKHGLNRLPYYPQLTVLTGGRHGALTLLLSALLFWNTRDAGCRFQKKQHLYQLSLHLKLPLAEIEAALQELYARGLIHDETQRLPRRSGPKSGEDRAGDEAVEYLERTYTLVEFDHLAAALQEAGESHLCSLVLEHAADDSFELYDVINKERLPLVQKLCGQISGADFDRAALACAALAVSLTAADPAFAQKAVAPGWRMLLQPPVTAEDIASRWQRPGERAIDLEFADGTIFIPDSACFGAREHHVSHHGSAAEPRIFAAAFLLAACSACDALQLITPLPAATLQQAALLLTAHTALRPRAEAVLFHGGDLNAQEAAAQQRQWQEFVRQLP